MAEVGLYNKILLILDGCKHRAIGEGRNLQDVVTDALEGYLKKLPLASKSLVNIHLGR